MRRSLFRRLVLLIAAVLSVSLVTAEPMFSARESCIASETYSPFTVSMLPDALLLGGGLATVGTGFLLQQNYSRPDWDGAIRNGEQINDFDGLWFNPYNKTLDTVATVTCLTNMAVIPLAVFGAEALGHNLPGKELLNISLMYAESCLWAYGSQNILKVLAGRDRPYTYYEDVDEGGLDNHDFMESFPSGHSTFAFMSAGFVSYVFSEYYPDSRYKSLVYIASYSCALATAALRVSSGNHFLTDVAGGAALGSIIGIGIPALHHVFSDYKYNRNRSIQILPDGFAATVYF